MVVDTSALIAILYNEPERRAFNEAIEAAENRAMSTASFVEASIILESRYGPDGSRSLDLFISKAHIQPACTVVRELACFGPWHRLERWVTDQFFELCLGQAHEHAIARHAHRCVAR